MSHSAFDDLWPNNIAMVPDRTPLLILRRQAEALAAKTQGVVEGQVKSFASPHELDGMVFSGPPKVLHRFFLKSTSFNYRFELLSIEHDLMSFYPVVVKSIEGEYKVTSEEEFIAKLSEIFASDSTRNVIQSLIAQSVA